MRERGGRQPNPTNNVRVLGVKIHILENDKRSRKKKWEERKIRNPKIKFKKKNQKQHTKIKQKNKKHKKQTPKIERRTVARASLTPKTQKI